MISRMLRSLLAAATTTLLLALLATTALAGVPGTWTQVTGPQDNTTEVGLARTGDGTLHVLWAAKSGLGGTVNHSAISANAKTLSGPNAVHSYADGLNNRLTLLAVPGGLRAFFAGLVGTEASPLQGRLATATSADGTAWAVQPDSASNNTSSPSSVYAGAGTAAATLLDGSFVTAWGDAGSGYHFGLSSTDPDVDYASGSCCVYAPGIGVDAVSGETVLAWQFLQASNGTAYQTLRPALGGIMQPPGANNASTSTRTGITGRIGAPGIYIAYLGGTNQFLAVPSVVKTGSSSVIKFSKYKTAQHVGIANAPDGRLWVFFEHNKKLVASRSNPAATVFGAPVAIKPPKGVDVIYNLAGNGSLGPLDLIALGDKSGTLNNWHQRIMPGLSITAKSAKGKITFTVTDAGVPVKSAKVKAGGKSKKTNAAGKATIKLKKGKYKSTATKTGYTPASITAKAK